MINPFKRLIDATKRSKQAAVQETQGQIFVSSLCSNAENVFAQLRPLVDELKMVEPYGVGRNGAKLALSRTPELMTLKAPNEKMGWAEFADLMFSTWLTEKELNIHVWKDERGKVYGYSVLPVDSRKTSGGIDYFEVPLASGGVARYSADEVMTLRFSRNPKNIDNGISPGIASMVWAQIDDVLAQYQLGHFENGAVPAYITIVRASTREKYLEKRQELERGFHGAKNKGKTLFLWRQFLDDGTEKDEVEVKTIQGSNASLAIKDIMSIVNDKLNKAFGVSNFILGDDSSAKYDNAELSQQQFLSHRVYPALYTFWSQFEHELTRVLPNGLPYAISWDLEIPELTDRVKVKAETKKIEAETRKLEDDMKLAKSSTLLTLLNAGASPDATVKALGLDIKWLEVARSISSQNDMSNGSSDNPTPEEVVDSGEISDISHNHSCQHCHRTTDAKEPEFSPDETIERGVYQELIDLLQTLINDELGRQLGLSEEEVQSTVDRINRKLLEMAEKGAQTAIEETQKSIKGLPAAVIVGIINGSKPKTRAELLKAIEMEKTAQGVSNIEQLVAEKMQDRTSQIIKGFRDEAVNTIKQTLNQTTGLSASEIRKQLSDTMPKFRAEMIARNETVNSFRLGQLEEAKHIADKYHLKLRKTWHAYPGECPICAAMDGTTVDLTAPFPAEQVDQDGVTYAYEHSDFNNGGETPNAHVNCRCTFSIEVVPA